MPNRTLCNVLQEMRTCCKTKNFSYLEGLIEEAQTLANRMEAALWDQKEFLRTQKKHKKLKAEVKLMQEQLEGSQERGNFKRDSGSLGIGENW